MDPQLSRTCKLLELPRELRDEIYIELFSSTQLTFPSKITRELQTVELCLNALAILHTCRQINQETRQLWLGLVLFKFERLDDLLDKLSPLPPSTLSGIRHLWTSGEYLVLPPISRGDDYYYCHVGQALKLLPFLDLDRLTVVGSSDGSWAYETLEYLIDYGNGWEELHFAISNYALLAFEKKIGPGVKGWRMGQILTELVLNRDNYDSGTNISIYRSTQPAFPGLVMNPLTRQVVEQVLQDLEAFDCMIEDDELVTTEEEIRESLVIARRGHDADITEGDKPPNEPWDTRS